MSGCMVHGGFAAFGCSDCDRRARNTAAQERNEWVGHYNEAVARARKAEAEVARLRAVLETLDEYITTGASHEALRVVVFDALRKEKP